MKKFLLTVLLVLQSIITFAQFKPGYIINNDNDTIFGQIQTQKEIEYCKYLYFKRNKSDTLYQYFPGQIKSFRIINGDYYLTATIPYKNQMQIVFLQWLVKGKANLLVYNNALSDIRYYIQLGDSTYHELKNTKTNIVSGEKVYEKENKEYLGSLTYYFKDVPQLKEELPDLKYKKESLIEITREYHTYVCPDMECEIYQAPKQTHSYNIGFSLDYNIIKLHIPYDAQINNTNVFGAGLLFSISELPLITKGISLQTGIGFSRATFYYNEAELSHFYPPIEDNKLFTVTNFKIPVFATYHLQTKFIRPFFGAGPAFVFRTSDVVGNSYLINRAIDGTWSKGKIFSGFNYSLNLLGGLSIKIGSNLNLEYSFIFEKMNNFFGSSPSDRTSINTLRNSLSLSYILKK